MFKIKMKRIGFNASNLLGTFQYWCDQSLPYILNTLILEWKNPKLFKRILRRSHLQAYLYWNRRASLRRLKAEHDHRCSLTNRTEHFPIPFDKGTISLDLPSINQTLGRSKLRINFSVPRMWNMRRGLNDENYNDIVSVCDIYKPIRLLYKRKIL